MPEPSGDELDRLIDENRQAIYRKRFADAAKARGAKVFVAPDARFYESGGLLVEIEKGVPLKYIPPTEYGG